MNQLQASGAADLSRCWRWSRARPSARGRRDLRALFADWESERKSADVDARDPGLDRQPRAGLVAPQPPATATLSAQVPSCLWACTVGTPFVATCLPAGLFRSSPTVRPGNPAASKYRVDPTC